MSRLNQLVFALVLGLGLSSGLSSERAWAGSEDVTWLKRLGNRLTCSSFFTPDWVSSLKPGDQLLHKVGSSYFLSRVADHSGGLIAFENRPYQFYLTDEETFKSFKPVNIWQGLMVGKTVLQYTPGGFLIRRKIAGLTADGLISFQYEPYLYRSNRHIKIRPDETVTSYGSFKVGEILTWNRQSASGNQFSRNRILELTLDGWVRFDDHNGKLGYFEKLSRLKISRIE